MRIVKQKTYIINRRLQYSVLGFLALWTLATFAMLYLLADRTIAAMSLFVPGTPAGEAMLGEIRHSAYSSVLIAGIGMLVVSGVVAIYTLNRVAGPIFRLRRHILENIESGQITPITFRKKDFFSDLAEAYNDLAKRFPNT